MLSGGFIECARDDYKYGSNDLEESELGSSDGMCAGNEYGKFEGSSLVKYL